MTTCTNCSAKLDEGSVVCARCVSAVAVQPRVAETTPVDVPAYIPGDGLKGIGGWLILPAIGLAISPFVSLHGLFKGIGILTSSRYETVLSARPGLATLILFEIITNTILFAASVCLNFIFYWKKRIFPRCAIAYYGLNFFVMLADHLATVSLLPSSDNSAGAFGAVRALVICVIWIPYFLNSQRVEQTFVN
jgi:hypothetical protein